MREYEERREIDNFYEKAKKNIKKKIEDKGVSCKGSAKGTLPPVTPKPKTDVHDKIRAEINSPNRGTCDYFIVDRIEEIIDKYTEKSEPQGSDIEKRKPCINCENGCEEWAGCPCVHYKAKSEDED